MAEHSMFEDYSDLMNVSLASEYDRMEDLDGEVLNDIVQIIQIATSTLTLENRAPIDECIQTLNNQPTIQSEISEAMNKKRKEFSPEQIRILENEFSKCQTPDPCKCDQIAAILKLSSRKVNSWFKKRREVQEGDNQSSSNSSVKLILRLVKQSEDVNAWSVFRPDTIDCSSSVSKSSPPCRPKEFPASPSMPICSEQIDPKNNYEYQNTEFQYDITTAKRLITGRRLRLTPQQRQTLEEEWLLSPYVSDKTCYELSKRLGISKYQIKTWFRNRRHHAKKQAKKSGNYTSVPTTSCRKRKRGDVSSTSKEQDFDTMSVCSTASSFAWDLEDSQSYNSDFGSTAATERSSWKQCKSERTWEDYQKENDGFSIRQFTWQL